MITIQLVGALIVHNGKSDVGMFFGDFVEFAHRSGKYSCRLLDQNVYAVMHRFDGNDGMQIVRRRNDNRVHDSACNQLNVIFKNLDAVQFGFRPKAPFGIDVANGGQHRVFDRFHFEFYGMDRTHFPDSDDAEPYDFFHKS